MLRKTIWTAVAALALAGVVSQPAVAGDTLKLAPADALGAVVIDDLAAIDAKLEAAAEKIQLPLVGPLTAMKSIAGLDECIDTESKIVAVLLEGEDVRAQPAPVILVPVKDFDAFVEILEGEADEEGVYRLGIIPKPTLAAKKDGCAVIVPEQNADLLEVVLQSSGGLDETLGDDAAWVSDRDVAVVATKKGISLFCDKVVEGINMVQLMVQGRGEQAQAAVQGLEIYKKMFTGINAEMQMLGVGLNLQASGDVVIHIRKQFLPGGELAACLDVGDGTPDLLAGMPDEPFVVAGGTIVNPALGDLMMRFSIDAMAAAPQLYGIKEEQTKKLIDLAKPITDDLKSLSVMITVGEDGDPVYSRMVAVMSTGDAEQYMQAYKSYMDEFGALMKDSDGMFSMPMETKPIEIEGHEGIEVTMSFPDEFMQQAAGSEAMLEELLGPGGKIKAFIVAADEKNVLIGYTSQTLLKKAIAVLAGEEDALADAATIKAAAENLEGGNFSRGYFSPAGTVDFINSMLATLPPFADQGLQLPPFPETPPVAWSSTAHGATADGQVVLPAELFKASVMYSAVVRKTFQQ